MQELLTARKRLVFDEFLLFVSGSAASQEKDRGSTEYIFHEIQCGQQRKIIEGLPYELTNAQKNVWA